MAIMEKRTGKLYILKRIALVLYYDCGITVDAIVKSLIYHGSDHILFYIAVPYNS